jgi:threonine dehydratase
MGKDGRMTSPIDAAEIRHAFDRISPHVRATPVIDVPGGLGLTSQPLSLKLELLQHTGSFKARGAFNNLMTRQPGPAGVAAASGGNHGAAVAFAARALGHRARIFVPEISSPAKIARIRAYGADLVVGGRHYDDAQDACDTFVQDTSALKIHPFDAWETLAGQGTVAQEWEAQAPDLDTVLVAAGGGGLVAGMALWYSRRVRVIAVEPEGSCALASALDAGQPVDVPVESLAADSLGARNVGAKVHALAAAYVDSVALVPDSAIVDAMRLLWQELRLVTEPGGATALAALLCGAYTAAPTERVGVLVCGGNVDLQQFQTLTA